MVRAEDGFTFLEILVGVVIIGIFCVAIGAKLVSIGDNARVTIALQEMEQIKEAVRDYFYPNLGVLPQDPGPDGEFASGDCDTCSKDDRPWFATRYLCLRNDGQDNPEYLEMYNFLTAQMTEPQATDRMTWSRYFQAGWQGPYMETNVSVLLDDTATYAMPLIRTPWADITEGLAQAAQDVGDTARAGRLRRGEYYFIVVDRDETNGYAPIIDSARILCFGQDGADSGSYYEDYDSSSPQTLATAGDLRKLPCNGSGSSSDNDCYETGDDLVMFIFGGGANRQPAQ